jgi:hypothetical protein
MDFYLYGMGVVVKILVIALLESCRRPYRLFFDYDLMTQLRQYEYLLTADVFCPTSKEDVNRLRRPFDL